MDVILSYELTNAEDWHLSDKCCRYLSGNKRFRHSFQRSQFRRYDNRCHINDNNAVIVQSSPKPNNESKIFIESNSASEKVRIQNNYQYLSDSELCKMPIDFENSSMKNSFSMSSLQSSSRVCLEQSSQATMPELPNRAYSSLKYKMRKKTPEQECWRSSWGHDDQKVEFWTSFETNYQYLMNNNLIDSCKEAKNDLSISPSRDWTFYQFKQQFLDLDQWLTSTAQCIQDTDDHLVVQNIRLNQIEEMKYKNYQRKNFVSQSSRLVTRYPEYKDEIVEYVSQLNTRWDKLAQSVSPKRNITTDSSSMSIDVHYELHCLSEWIITMENKVEPISFRRKWSRAQLKQKAKEHKAVQRDVKSHSKIVLNLVKLCEKYSQSKGQVDGASDRRLRGKSSLNKARYWEKRWHFLYLRCLEWQCYIEEQMNIFNTGNYYDTCAESDDEHPASKHPRLNGCIVRQSTCLSSVSKSEDGNVDDLMDSGDDLVMAVVVQNDIDLIGAKQRNSAPLNNADFCEALKKLPIEELKKMMPPKFSMFNTTDVSAPNAGIYYMPHEDTESEHERQPEKNSGDDAKSQEESSGDECTYKNVENCTMDMDASANEVPLLNGGNKKKEEETFPDLRTQFIKVLDLEKLEPHSIHELVQKADEIVYTTKKFMPRKKGSSAKARHNEQVREWLRKCQDNDDYSPNTSIGDSCDASGETEDDDQGERYSSCDQTTTVIGSSRDNGIDVSPLNEFLPITEPIKVVLRNKSGQKKSRPFSTSELNHCTYRKLSSMQWVSESALNKMLTPLKDARNALSSSTIEEYTTHTLEGSVNSLRKRKYKHRRRSTLGRKGHSGSADSLSSLAYHQTTMHRFCRSPVRLASHHLRSETFSEPVMMRQQLSSMERAIASDPSNCIHNSPSGTETEEDLTQNNKCIRKKLFNMPAFRLGPQHGVVGRRDCKIALSATSTEEQMSSFSENAWDDFQERYVSEAYSEEPIDLDQVKKLTDFGDDYRNYIDSHSDCASSFTRSHPFAAHSTLIAGDESSAADSDSELEDVRKLLQRSHAQLCCSEQLFAKLATKPISCFILSESDFADLRNTCHENVRCLRVLLERIEVDELLFHLQQKTDTKSMLDKWENLEGKTVEMERKCYLQRDIMDLRKYFLDISTMPDMAFQVEGRFQLENQIQIVQTELDCVISKEHVISEYNVRAHRLLNDSKHISLSLKEDINDLYRIWEETRQKISRQLSTLLQAASAWRNFDMHMAELKTVLREDHTALNMLDQALKREEYIFDVAHTVKNIAKYLPEKHHESLMKVNANSTTVIDSDQIDSMSSVLMSALNVEGSFSDSGISDSGSEQDICERERRLTVLRKLARHLEAILTPGSEALLSIMKKIDEAEEEIRELQQTCRTIIQTGYLEKREPFQTNKVDILKENVKKKFKSEGKTCPDDPGSDPSKGRSVFWRMLRAALPFHIAIVVLVCVSCLLEPNCCDVINNLNLSLSPQLRYISGPPPT